MENPLPAFRPLESPLYDKVGQMNTDRVTTRRPRSTQLTTPDAKRIKTSTPAQEEADDAPVRIPYEESKHLDSSSSDTSRSEGGNEEWKIPYPTNLPAPSKKILSKLLNSEEVNAEGSDQSLLKPAGILSLDQILLPSLALQEEQALKRLQAKVQRDAPESKETVLQARRLVRRAILRAVQAVQDSRQQRMIQRKEREEAAKQRRALAIQEAQGERAKEEEYLAQEAHEQAFQKHHERFQALQRQLPRNKDLWKEIVVLSRSRTQLEKEYRMWKQAEQDLAESAATRAQQNIVLDESPSSQRIQAPKSDLQTSTEATVEEMVLASKRIQSGLELVASVMNDSKSLREKLYEKYTHEQQFKGYQGVNNPKSLIRFLSQDDYE
eukprot:Nitzschia sp. Nitz4//scaffold88_size82704//52419//53561//NITZ4_005299-RA/size82704-processed-gene-0.54-mRNA-1//1//CDS//3329559515//7601//frame0